MSSGKDLDATAVNIAEISDLESRPQSKGQATVNLSETSSTHELTEIKQNAAPELPPRPTEAWPLEPVPLVPSKKSSMMLVLFDVVLISLPLILITKIGLIIGAWHLDRDHRGMDIDLVSSLTLFLMELNDQLVTAFTVVFVTIISTLVRRYALWKAEKGAYVSQLEQLQGSISMVSTLKLIWSLKAFSRMSVVLVAVWSFYYLGSQAAQREFKRVASDPYRKLQGEVAGYAVPSIFEPSFGKVDDDPTDTGFTAASAFYIVQTLGTQGRPGTDLSGNPLIPNINSILERGWPAESGNVPPKIHRHGWVDISKQSLIQKAGYYTSVIGRAIIIPLASDEGGVSQAQVDNVVGDYTFEAGYLQVACDYPQILPFDDFVNGTGTNQSLAFNMTAIRPNAPLDRFQNPLREFHLSTRWVPLDTGDDGEITAYGSSRQTCNISLVNVEMKAHCLDTGCFPNRIRYKDNAGRQNATSYSTPFDDDKFAATFFNRILLSSGPQTNTSVLSNTPSMLVSDLPTYLGSGEDYYTNFVDVADSNLNNTLTRYFNSYYMQSQNSAGTFPTFRPNDPYYNNVTLKGAPYDPHYAIFWPWIAVDFVSCMILLTAAVVAHILRVQTLAPDIFGYVSSLTRDNPNLELPTAGTTLNGIERARMLKDIKVKIGDVSSPEETTGRVGLAQVGSHKQVEQLKRTTNYV